MKTAEDYPLTYSGIRQAQLDIIEMIQEMQRNPDPALTIYKRLENLKKDIGRP